MAFILAHCERARHAAIIRWQRMAPPAHEYFGQVAGPQWQQGLNINYEVVERMTAHAFPSIETYLVSWAWEVSSQPLVGDSPDELLTNEKSHMKALLRKANALASMSQYYEALIRKVGNCGWQDIARLSVASKQSQLIVENVYVQWASAEWLEQNHLIRLSAEARHMVHCALVSLYTLKRDALSFARTVVRLEMADLDVDWGTLDIEDSEDEIEVSEGETVSYSE
jgi:hypothetical protein